MSKDRNRPLIGVTLDSEPAGGYAELPWYALRENYCDAIASAGGVPIALPHEIDLVAAYLEVIDGLVVTGGAFDVDPGLYGGGEHHQTVTLKHRRTAFEWRMTERAVAEDMPVLGICGGQQLLNVVLGGTLFQHIPDAVESCLAHEQPNSRTEPGHQVEITANTLLHSLAGTTRIAVNSAHHQAADRIGPGVVVSAMADDGVIEAIELPGKRFCLGVQWHPEYHISTVDSAIIGAFVDVARSL